jgi:hypothetical protein
MHFAIIAKTVTVVFASRPDVRSSIRTLTWRLLALLRMTRSVLTNSRANDRGLGNRLQREGFQNAGSLSAARR